MVDGVMISWMLLDFYIQCIEQLNLVINVIVVNNYLEVCSWVDVVDVVCLKGEIWGLLYGLLFMVKDIFEVVGMFFMVGVKCLVVYWFECSVIVVQSLYDVGVIVFGKINILVYVLDL